MTKGPEDGIGGDGPPQPQQPGNGKPPPEVDAGAFQSSFGESLGRALDLDTWSTGQDLAALHDRLEREVGEAIDADNRHRPQVRRILFPRITRQDLPCAGVFKATRRQLEHVQTHVLFNGAVEAADGISVVHDTLPITIAQIGICLASYAGDSGAWSHRMYRRDLRVKGMDPVEEAMAVLEQRDARAGTNQPGGTRDDISNLLRRGIMAYAERAVLLRKSDKPWRMGHGHPAPYELLTGSGSMQLLKVSLDLLRDLVLTHRRFVFVPSEPGERMLLTIGNALHPAEYAIVETAERRMAPVILDGHLRDPHRENAIDFYNEAAPQIIVGVYRTFAETPPQLFYAHRDHAHEAALIAMADSLLQPHRNFPALIDLADTTCGSLFGTEGFNATVEAAYAAKGEPLKYLSERATR